MITRWVGVLRAAHPEPPVIAACLELSASI